MNKKGFTLIELLAVIAIIAVIMLIVTPIVLKTIQDSRKGAFINSAYGIIKSAEYEFSQNAVNGKQTGIITYSYSDLGETSTPSGYALEYKGDKPKNGKVVVNEIGLIAVAIHDGTYCIEKGYNDTKVVLTEKLLVNCNIE